VRLSDTLTGQLVELPEPPAKIGMYVCGPTVYQRAHIGNARPYVVFAWLARWLRHKGHEVTFVHNITDVDDKILAAPGPSVRVATQAADWYLQDIGDLGLGLPDALPRATETIPEIIAMIDRLIVSGHAYDVDGDVYFRVARSLEYGQLSGQLPDEVAEQEPNPQKEDPRDFALWKSSKPGEDLAWESPWGRGRPGWHIECSAMAEKLLGPSFEIHGSGRDIIFPHNENERAQSLALGSDFAHIWMHNGMLRQTGEKMSKSVGNVSTIREVLDEWGPETTLLFFLGAHWRKPIDFSAETMAAAAAQWARLSVVTAPVSTGGPSWDDLVATLEDDFDTPAALAILNAWHRAGHLELLNRGTEIFGLPPARTPAVYKKSGATVLAAAASGTAVVVPPEIEILVQKREAARDARNFAEADRLRQEILDADWDVRDDPGGTSVAPRRSAP
jgi:cysteinyl-tRNA synthetase